MVGHIPTPADIWERYVPESFASVASRHFSGVGPPSDEAVVMLHALHSQNLLFPLPSGSPGPNGGVLAIPKTLDKCSLIVNLVPVNKEMPEKPEKFSLPSVEVLALLAQVARQGSSIFLPPPPPFYSRTRCLWPVWEVLGLPGVGGDEELCVCHIDLSNCFWSLRLPETFWGAFRFSDGEGGVLSFRCLPFGWKYSPILCRKVLERLVEGIGLVGLLVLIYIDNVLIVGRGKGRAQEHAMGAVQAWRARGGVISPKSTLEPVTRLVWLGKDVDLGGSLRTAGNAWEALLAHWLRLSVGVCSVRRLQQFLGRAQWICRPRFGPNPHLSWVWAHVVCPPPSTCSLPCSSCCALYVWCVCWLCWAGRWYP